MTQKRIEELEAALKRSNGQLLQRTGELLALRGGVAGTAVEDAGLRFAKQFTLADDGRMLARDAAGNVIHGRSGPLTPDEWLDGQRQSSPHWWNAAKGQATGVAGGSQRGGSQTERGSSGYSTDFNEFSQQREREVAASRGY